MCQGLLVPRGGGRMWSILDPQEVPAPHVSGASCSSWWWSHVEHPGPSRGSCSTCVRGFLFLVVVVACGASWTLKRFLLHMCQGLLVPRGGGRMWSILDPQ